MDRGCSGDAEIRPDNVNRDVDGHSSDEVRVLEEHWWGCDLRGACYGQLGDSMSETEKGVAIRKGVTFVHRTETIKLDAFDGWRARFGSGRFG